MSSLAAARADNFYLDPENPQKPTKKLKRNADGNLTIRFEMPFDTQCLGCHLSIAKGVRFNAEKFKAGNYHSTTIWGFRMKSPCCKTPIEIRTNPKEADYDAVAGVRRTLRSLVGRRRTAEDEAGTAEDVGGAGGAGGGGRGGPGGRAGRSATAGSKMSKLESKLTKERVARGSHRNLETLKERSYDRYGEDSERNRELRRSMRSVRNEVRERERRRDELGLCDAVTLLPETRLDRSRASAVVFHGKTRENTLLKRRKIMKQGIFTRKLPKKE